MITFYLVRDLQKFNNREQNNPHELKIKSGSGTILRLLSKLGVLLADKAKNHLCLEMLKWICSRQKIIRKKLYCSLRLGIMAG